VIKTEKVKKLTCAAEPKTEAERKNESCEIW